MSRAESWEAVARALGARMANHSGYCAEGHEPGAVEDCPFCADHRAYMRFVRKAGKPRDPFADAKPVTLAELSKREETS